MLSLRYIDSIAVFKMLFNLFFFAFLQQSLNCQNDSIHECEAYFSSFVLVLDQFQRSFIAHSFLANQKLTLYSTIDNLIQKPVLNAIYT